MHESLARLAAAAGIEPGYWDGLGQRRDLGGESARALLRALGFDPDADPETQARALENRGFEATLPPVVFAAADVPLSMELTLADDAAAGPLAWRVTLESGVETCGTAQPERIAAAEQHVVGPIGRARYRIGGLPAVPPGYHDITLPDMGETAALIGVPAACHVPPALAGGGRCWGLSVQLYSLRSRRNWGMGDFTDLARLAGLAGRGGAALIGLNPLHARHLARPAEASPYAPSSRLALDPMYLDVEAIEDYGACAAARSLVESDRFQAHLDAARRAPLVDHAAILALKLPVLRLLHEAFVAHPDQPRQGRADDFRAFVARGGSALQRYAVFEALCLDHKARGAAGAGWRAWSAGWRDPDSPQVRAFRASNSRDVEFQMYLQWQADLQLSAAAAAARSAGMSIGLYRDLAVGAADDGAETWSAGDLIAPGVSVGAPPDLLNREGQDWGLPPWNPRALEARRFAPLRDLLAANMRHAGALRIDHVMALTRLFWIPAGQKGAAGGYVRYPFEAMAGVVALESLRNRCLVVGEDLGSVPDGLREGLAARGLLSYRVLLFERHWNGDGSFKRPWEYPAQALATVVTHDMPTIAEFWQGGDIERRAQLGMFPDAATGAAEAARRGPDRERLLALLGELGLAPPLADAAAITPALHAAVARTDAMLAVVQLDDVAGEVEPVNIPGTHVEYPNWQRKVGLHIEDLEHDARWQTLVATMRTEGRSGGPA